MEEMQVLPAPPENQEQLLHFATQYQQLMLLYEGGIKQITTKLDILNREHRVRGMRTPIETVKSRLKTPRSIADKLSRRGLELSIRSILEISTMWRASGWFVHISQTFMPFGICCCRRRT